MIAFCQFLCFTCADMIFVMLYLFPFVIFRSRKSLPSLGTGIDYFLGIKRDSKLEVHKAVVLPTLLYACETWTGYKRHTKRLNHLRKLLKSSGKTRFQTLRSGESRDAMHAYSLKADWPCYKNA